MPIKKSVHACYPNGKDRKSYIDGLISKYKSAYNKNDVCISNEQFMIPIVDVVCMVDFAIKALNAKESMLFEINFLRKISNNDVTAHEINIGLMDYHYHSNLHSYVQNTFETSSIVLRRNGSPFPESYKEAYLQFIQQMLKEVVLEITETRRVILEKPVGPRKSVSFFNPNGVAQEGNDFSPGI